ncbi:hypothetical protein N473_18415 [Pseudoalteromonas luteoviolacea CPMOR-1]|uniref:Uncharacterized protein n=1 Tax=Pseudoalteromonas luteoviolacea CPMOR-1 TaxID=1365248 RepID=A0A167KJH8_9GAMM|nr:hypothetical protein [Pseudoalteromonas luteoviolacea]KZN62890.1 hypothetical protein N473_18415 [Pseudoalteromonas luteoviolacea CPMOR-1]
MLAKADVDINSIKSMFFNLGISPSWLVPTETGLKKSILDAHSGIVSYFFSTGLHDFSSQKQGQAYKKLIPTKLVTKDKFIETTTSLYRPETKKGDPRMWISRLPIIAKPFNLLAIFVLQDELYVINVSQEGFLSELESRSSLVNSILEKVAINNNVPLSDRFSEWNLRLLQSFFTKANQNEEVFLRIDSDWVDSIGQDIGGYEGFKAAVIKGPDWLPSKKSLVETAIELVKFRNASKNLSLEKYKDPGKFDTTYCGLSSPTYLPYLAALIVTSSKQTSDFYKRFSQEMNLDSTLQIDDMKQLEKVWDDLSDWTREQNGALGFFNVRRLGGYKHIGIPRSQSIVTQSDFDSFHKVFASAEIRAGSKFSKTLLDKIKNELKVSAYLFTNGFQEALKDRTFSKAIDETLRYTYLDWDGTCQDIEKRDSSDTTKVPLSKANARVSFLITDSSTMQLVPVWEIYSIKDSGTFELYYNKHCWHGRFLSTEFGYTTLGESPSLIWEAMTSSFQDKQELLLKVNDTFEEEKTLTYSLPIHKLWILTIKLDSYLNKHKLVESVLPSYGSVFILIPPPHIEMVFKYLENQEVDFEPMDDIKGICEDWVLIKITDCAELTQEQRLLPDGRENPHPRVNSLKLVGGRRIKRGGTHMFLPYDLPELEVTIPSGATITSSAGAKLHELKSDSIAENNLFNESFSTRRFEIEVPKNVSSLNEFTAFDTEGKQIGHVKLRVASTDGDIVNSNCKITLDNLGKCIRSGEGLHGAILNKFDDLDYNTVREDYSISKESKVLGSQYLDPDYIFGIIECFLDALAIAGALNYGIARNLLQRLIHKHHSDTTPILILLYLRQVGRIELTTTNRGHIVSVNSVKPTIVELPITTVNGRVYGVVGTLRLKQWDLIDNLCDLDVIYATPDKFGFSGRRIISNSQEKIKEMCNKHEFHFVRQPSKEILEWANGIEQFKLSISGYHIESLVGQSKKKFSPGKALFTDTSKHYDCELWKMDDLGTYLDNLYVVNLNGSLSFIRDSRWGTWLNIIEYAKWLRDMKYLPESFTVPITFHLSTSTIWIPARIGLPIVLDRALSLCSGLSPEVIKMAKETTQTNNSSINIVSENDKTTKLEIDCFYTNMAAGHWIKYEFIPEGIANKVAQLLNAKLDYR